MKTWLDRIVRNSSYLRLVVNYYKSDEISSFKKVSSYTVSDIDIKNKKLCKVVIENDIKPIYINNIQKDKILKYMEDTIILYHKNEIYLTEQDLKNYQKIYNVLSQGGQSIDSDLFNFINSDMNKSYNTNGYKNNNTDNF